MTKLLPIFLLFSITAKTAFPQGCNDAGFCTMGDLRPAFRQDSSAQEIGFSSSFRLGEKETMWLTLQPQVEINLWKSGKLSIQMPVHLIYGSLGAIAGVGDPAPAFTQVLFRKKETKITVTLGGKLPVNSAALRKNDEPLPMAYQASQGTWDAIAGISLFNKSWHFSAGFQHNFNANGNLYLDSLSLPDNTGFFDSRKIDRGDDVLLRVEKILETKRKQKYFIGILPIFRLQEATIENTQGDRVPVTGSSGLTLNINAGFLHPIGKKGNMKMLLGFPAVTRHVRPDGLTGTFVVSFSAGWRL